MEIAVLGHMGRDEALADRLEGHRLHVLGGWRNPGLVQKAEQSGGSYHEVSGISAVKEIADIVDDIQPDMFVTNFDDSLAAGVVDVIALRAASWRKQLLIPCPNQAASQIEWDKFMLRDIVERIAPQYNPINFMVSNQQAADKAISHFESEYMQIALKPRNLAGGKGVKVQGKHFESYFEARQYAAVVLSDPTQTGLEVQEKLEGHEFTLQLFTDGNVLAEAPQTYDYPYREDDDSGPGTGGMGCFSMEPGENLPFVTDSDYQEAMQLMRDVLQELKSLGLDYKGVLYPTFYKTAKGLKLVEINARGGDPELINILDLLDEGVDIAAVLTAIATGEFDPNQIQYQKLASTMLYLVSPEYGYKAGKEHTFRMDSNVITRLGCKVRFAAAEKIGNKHYKTVGSSRTVGILALAPTPWRARKRIDLAIDVGFIGQNPLQWRNDVGNDAYIRELQT